MGMMGNNWPILASDRGTERKTGKIAKVLRTRDTFFRVRRNSFLCALELCAERRTFEARRRKTSQNTTIAFGAILKADQSPEIELRSQLVLL